jgi:hypothetical protein
MFAGGMIELPGEDGAGVDNGLGKSRPDFRESEVAGVPEGGDHRDHRLPDHDSKLINSGGLLQPTALCRYMRHP